MLDCFLIKVKETLQFPYSKLAVLPEGKIIILKEDCKETLDMYYKSLTFSGTYEKVGEYFACAVKIPNFYK